MDIKPRQRSTRSVIKPVPQTPQPNVDLSKLVAKPAKKTNKKKFIRYSLVAVNLLILGLVGYVVVLYSGGSSSSYGAYSSENIGTSNPLDSLSAADIAANIASMTGMPEQLAVSNQAEVVGLYLNASVIDKEYVTKTQILSAEIKSKEDIINYVVVEGDTVASLAEKFGVTSDSINWSNDLRDNPEVGKTLVIPPVNGIVHKVGVGETADSLAEKFSVDAKQIIAFNDAEITGLVLGDTIVVPGGTKPRSVINVYSYRANYGFNGYWYGYCTWYVATKINVPNNWRNANRWDDFARITPGWTVSNIPVVGAIAQNNYGPEGHVAIVEEVSADGTMIKYSDMNGLAGWGREGRSPEWVPAATKFQNYIYRAQ